MTPAEKRAKTMRENWVYQRELGQRIRRLRLEAGLTIARAGELAGVELKVWGNYEVGKQRCSTRSLPAIAAALGIPVASLLTDRRVLMEVQVSEETLELVRREGRPAAIAAIERISDTLVTLLIAEASRPPRDLSPHARAKPRRSREQVLIESKARLAAHKAAELAA